MKKKSGQTVVLCNEPKLLRELLIGHVDLHQNKQNWLVVPSNQVKLDLYTNWAIEHGAVNALKTFTLMDFFKTLFANFGNFEMFPSILEISICIAELFQDPDFDQSEFPSKWQSILSSDEKSPIQQRQIAAEVYIDIANEIFHANLHGNAIPSLLQHIQTNLEKRNISFDFIHLFSNLHLPNHIHCHFYGFSSLPKQLLAACSKISDRLGQTFYFCMPSLHHVSTLDETILKNALLPMAQNIREFEKQDVLCELQPIFLFNPKEFAAYEKKIFHEGKLLPGYEKSVLTHIKMQALLLPEEPLHLQLDDSYLFFECSDYLREVEVVIDHVIDWMKKDPTLKAKDICFIAKDISLYKPYIDAVCQDPSARFSKTTSESSFASQNVMEGFLQMLKLGKGPFSFTELFTLFENPSLQKQAKLDQKEIDEFMQSIRNDFQSGYDEKQFHEYLEAQGEKSMMPIKKTWQHAISSLLSDALEGKFSNLLPLIEKMSALIEQLYLDLTPIREDQQLTIQQWDHYFTSLFSYFSSEKILKPFYFHCFDPSRKLHFSTLYPHVRKQICVDSLSIKEGEDGFKLLSLDQGLLPCRGLIFLGVTQEQLHSQSNLIHDLTTRRIEDQKNYLTQQFVLMHNYAKDFMWLSYAKAVGGLAHFIKNWFWELDQKLFVSQSKISKAIKRSNLTSSFDTANWEERACNLNYYQFFEQYSEPFYDDQPFVNAPLENIQQLSSFIVNPLKMQMDAIGLNSNRLEPHMQLSGHQKHALLHAQLTTGEKNKDAIFDGRLDLIADKQLEFEMQTISQQLQNEPLITLHFANNIELPFEMEDTRVFPAWQTPMGELEGVWNLATKQHLLLLGKNKLRAFFRAYPFYLALSKYQPVSFLFLQDASSGFAIEVDEANQKYFWQYIHQNWNTSSYLYPEILSAVYDNNKGKAFDVLINISYLPLREKDQELFFQWFDRNQTLICRAFEDVYEQAPIF